MALGTANILTLLRMAAAPILVVAFLVPGTAGEWFCLAVLAYAGISDWLDGYWARSRGTASPLGATLDPAADKMIVATALVMLAGSGMLSVVSVVAAAIILMREFLVSAVRETLGRSGHQVTSSMMAKCKTTVQFGALLILAAGSLAASAHSMLPQVGEWLLWVSAVLAILSGRGYVADFWARLREGAIR